MDIKKHPKIYKLEDRNVKGILDGEITITEKLDGSQFGFCITDAGVVCRTKRTTINLDKPDGLFKPAVYNIIARSHLIPKGYHFIGETLCKPKHNVLTYGDTPKGNVALFAGYNLTDEVWLSHNDLSFWATVMELDTVPVMYQGTFITDSPDERLNVDEYLMDLLDCQSYLGGTKIEGIVIYNGGQESVVEETTYPFMIAKLVSAAFKEQMSRGGAKAPKTTIEGYIRSFQVEARWVKALQRLTEEGEVTYQPKDIGRLIKYVHEDILAEEVENIKMFIWNMYGEMIIRRSADGLPEWYKDLLTLKEAGDI